MKTARILSLFALVGLILLAACQSPYLPLKSKAAAEAAAAEAAKIQIPAAPSAPSLTADDATLAVTWTAVTGATSYEVWSGTANDSAAATQNTASETGTGYNITGLTNGTLYYVWVKAKNSAGASAFSAVANGTPVAALAAPVAPGAPTLVAGSGQLAVSWTAVSGATAYEVWYGTSSSSGAATQFGGDVTGTTATITGLWRGNSYYVWLKAKNQAGASGFGTVGSDGGVNYRTITLTSNMDASVVIGASAMNATEGVPSAYSAQIFKSPDGLAIAGDGTLYLSQTSGYRISGFNSVPTSNYAAANFVLGQSSQTATVQGGTDARSFKFPTLVAAFGTLLASGDRGSHRVLLWTSLPKNETTDATIVLGQPDFTGGSANRGGSAAANSLNFPMGVAITSSKVLVADYSNNRVLIWNSIPTTNGQAADLVLGQADFTSVGANRGTAAVCSAGSLYSPYDVWSDGTRVIVGDGANNRVLIWNSFPTTNGQAADLVLGYSNMTTRSTTYGATPVTQSSLGVFAGSFEVAVQSNGTQIFVADAGNNRVLIWNTWPTTNGQAADVVLGQPNFTTKATYAPQTAKTIGTPVSLAVDGTHLPVGSGLERRVMVFNGQ